MLEIKKKHLDRREWYSDSDRDFSCIYHKDDFFDGVIGLITFTGLKAPDLVDTLEGKICIADNGYEWLELVPKNGNYALTAMFHDNELFQQYIDISLKNEVAENGDASFYDLFLDVVKLGDGTLNTIDNDELESALSEGIITKEEYDLAIRTANEVISFFTSNQDLLVKKLYEYRTLFKN
ncbi:DUF402 domain-containing protein [Butyrivibrio sp. YAB3001]|uniref:DUF402 domain-containing protein n=1 Tax=Butyrivibrio sp. YAB3001 TaxID=1520812 RepID=UPI0008F6410F|nr:DUF402 domain-containing protein [Butyrivibrio sp. YAB3001]SFB72966.1 hypothetical protein SAMN02910398_00480 [Butyrivibrio sp. YAB3001]